MQIRPRNAVAVKATAVATAGATAAALTLMGTSATAGTAPSAPASASATFDCKKAQGRVETLICNDAALQAMDRQLQQVYRSAAAEAKGTLAARLRADQRGWIKGRNGCWKSDGQTTWMTASWTVDSVRACVEAQYRQRTSALQATWRLRPATVLDGFCEGQAANEIVVNRFDTDPPTVRLERGDQSHTLWRVSAGAAETYEGQNVSLQLQSTTMTFTRLDTNSGKTQTVLCQRKG